jgi:hypothetical protein
MQIFWIAGRLHKTPAEVRAAFTLEEFNAYCVYCRMEADDGS